MSPRASDRVSRRDFVVVMAAAGGGLLLGCRVDGPMRAASGSAKSASAASPPAFAPNAFVGVGTDDVVTVVLPQAEMGQGVYTGLPMLVAEELGIGLDQVRVEHAPGDDRLYANPRLGFQATGGSTSTRRSTSRCGRRGPPPAPCWSPRRHRPGASIPTPAGPRRARSSTLEVGEK